MSDNNDTATSPSTTEEARLTEADRELLSGICDSEASRGPGYDGYCFTHYAPVKWEGRANADEVCCVYVEDLVGQVLASRIRPAAPSEEGES